uniref:Putative ovule protein n=1 Tax=Solanum chacoense TaxID=4108 RepID=A0A0V0H9I0_SOLCH
MLGSSQQESKMGKISHPDETPAEKLSFPGKEPVFGSCLGGYGFAMSPMLSFLIFIQDMTNHSSMLLYLSSALQSKDMRAYLRVSGN